MATTPSDWRWWLALRMVRGIGPVIFQNLLRTFETPAAIFAAGLAALERAGLRPDLARAIRSFDDWSAVADQQERMTRVGVALVTWNDPAYPTLLRQIHDPPPFLFVWGTLQATDSLAVAVVGSRNVSGYGLRMARELTEGLVQHGVTVVSGLARGTDAAAHWAALRSSGRTVAVLGSGLDVLYPPEHLSLARAIANQGAVVSELMMGTQPDAENFPGRNRIISGMSLGTVVIEAAERSGSLISALFALEQGREVFAVPGPVGERSRGVHRLIRQGAKLTESPRDILEEIAPQALGSALPSDLVLRPEEEAILRLLRVEPMHIDALMAGCGLASPVVLQTLLEMELRGLVRQLPGKCFAASAVDERRSLAKK